MDKLVPHSQPWVTKLSFEDVVDLLFMLRKCARLEDRAQIAAVKIEDRFDERQVVETLDKLNMSQGVKALAYRMLQDDTNALFYEINKRLAIMAGKNLSIREEKNWKANPRRILPLPARLQPAPGPETKEIQHSYYDYKKYYYPVPSVAAIKESLNRKYINAKFLTGMTDFAFSKLFHELSVDVRVERTGPREELVAIMLELIQLMKSYYRRPERLMFGNAEYDASFVLRLFEKRDKLEEKALRVALHHRRRRTRSVSVDSPEGPALKKARIGMIDDRDVVTGQRDLTEITGGEEDP